jgi:hypothetical protein
MKPGVTTDQLGASRSPTELTDAEIAAYVERCPELQREAFEGWLRGTRHLDGDLIDAELGQ